MIMAEPARRNVVKETNDSPAEAIPDELDLVRRAREGDLAAYDDLVKRYQERIYATVYHMTSNHEDANDLAQEAFIKAFQALSLLKVVPAFTPGFTGLPSIRPLIFSNNGRTSPYEPGRSRF